jgi:predicted aspartyl protease
MITGVLERDGKECVIWLDVRGPTGRTLRIKGVVDTGSTGTLTLPSEDIEYLELSWMGEAEVTLADASTIRSDVFEAEVTWDGGLRSIHVTKSESDPLVGMKLMQNYRLTVDIHPNGRYVLEPLDSITH